MRRKPVNVPKYWRERAEGMRTTAVRIADPEAKAIMLGTADGYDKVAQDAEARRESKNSK